MPSPETTPEPTTELRPEERQALLLVARSAIEHGLETGQVAALDPQHYPPALREVRASFVTLRADGDLRGCIGELEATRPLVESVAHQAFAAAFRDPRFPPLSPAELGLGLELHVSVLSPLEPLEVRSRSELLASLRPGIDGLLIEDGPCRATFLPAVWESLSDPEAFVAELLRKGGLAPDHWSPRTRAWRYSVESIAE